VAEAPPPPPLPAAVTSSGSSSKNTGIVIGIAVGTALAVLGQFCFFLLCVLKLCFMCLCSGFGFVDPVMGALPGSFPERAHAPKHTFAVAMSMTAFTMIVIAQLP